MTGWLCVSAYLLLVCLSQSAGVQCRSKGVSTEKAEQPDSVLAEYMTKISHEDPVASNGCVPIDKRVDRLAKRLATAAEKDERLQASLRLSLGLNKISGEPSELQGLDLATTTTRPTSTTTTTTTGFTKRQSYLNRSRRSLLHALSEPSSKHQFSRSYSEGQVVHQKRELDVDRFKSMVQEQFMKLPAEDRRAWLKAAKARSGATEKESDSGELIQKLLAAGIDYGPMLFDHFHSSADFVSKLPVIGQRVLEWRSKTKPLYHTVNVLRYTHSLYKLKEAEALAAAKGDQQQLSRLKREISAQKRLIGQEGLQVLYTLTELLMHSSAEEAASASGKRKEFVIRMFYSILSYATGANTACSAKPWKS
jgi:hypothetical protein